MNKVHLRRNKDGERASIAACATNPHVTRPTRNGRASYQVMASAIVCLADFRVADPQSRCAHCCDAALVIRNRQRRAKGLAPVSTWDESTDVKAGKCRWFLRCENPATTTQPHPILGDVSICARCADRVRREA